MTTHAERRLESTYLVDILIFFYGSAFLNPFLYNEFVTLYGDGYVFTDLEGEIRVGSHILRDINKYLRIPEASVNHLPLSRETLGVVGTVGLGCHVVTGTKPVIFCAMSSSFTFGSLSYSLQKLLILVEDILLSGLFWFQSTMNVANRS
jgi:hypothetical protein